MSWSLRRGASVLLVVVVLGSAAWIQSVHAQVIRVRRPIRQPVQPVVTPDPTPVSFGESGEINQDAFDHAGISLPKDEQRLARKIEAANDYAKDENWAEVVNILQKLVEIPTDVYARIPRKNPEGKEVPTWMSVRIEANRLIGELPPNGKDFYKLTFGPRAQDMLKKARETGDWQLLAQVAQRYRHTDAGAEARLELASHQLDRGDYTPAFRIYKSLIDNAGKAKLAPSVLVRAAMAAHVAGGKDGEATEKLAWKLLREQTREVALGNRTWAVDDLEEAVSRRARASYAVQASDAPMFRSNPNRTNLQVGGPAFLDRRWHLPTMESATETIEKQLRDAETQLSNQGRPLLDASFPITAVGFDPKKGQKVPLVVCRGHGGIMAVNALTGSLMWKQPTTWSLESLLGTDNPDGGPARNQAVTSWLQFYIGQQTRPEILFENSVLGTLSADSNFVYAVDDLAVPPPPHLFNMNMGFPGQGTTMGDEEMTKAVGRSQLYACSLARGGALEWRLGEEGTELADCLFLGPPLPLDGKIYLLVEKQQEIRLVCVDPTAPDTRPGKKAGRTMGKVVSTQTLGTTHQQLKLDVIRRTTAAQLAYGEGILVCPTNAGAVFAINLLENSLVWAYPYRDKADAPNMAQNPGFPPGMVMPGGMPGMAGNPNSSTGQWKVSAPVIQDGKVVFTAPDARDIHCVNLRDGSQLWKKHRKEDDLFMAGVYNGKVLIVGKKHVRALNLATGEEAWPALDIGTPSGQGVASDNIYYLPLAQGSQSKQPEICAIDLERGAILAHNHSRKYKPDGDKQEEVFDVPGNLLFYEGLVLSQRPTELVAYPQVKVKIAQMDELLARNPSDPVGLTERGELRLDQGDLPGAIADLSLALKNKPADEIRDRARAKLYDTLTQYIQRDFNAAEQYLDEYEELCKVDVPADASDRQKEEARATEQRRRADFLCLVGKGREAQGKLVEAFEKYQKFGNVVGNRELVSVIDEPSVKAAPDVWSRGRIAAMVARATPEQRKPLEEMIAQRWKDVQNTSDIEQLRSFVRVFGSLSSAGNDARFALAERLLGDNSKEHLIEAERELSYFRGPQEDPRLAARAVETLARLYKRKELFEDAAYCYRLLGSKYANIVIRDGKKGRQFYEEGYMDRRTVGHMDEPAPLRVQGEIRVQQDNQQFPMHQHNTYHFEHAGEALPFFQAHDLVLQMNTHQLKLFDRKKGTELWSQTLTQSPTFQMLINQQANQPKVRFPYRTQGHLIVLPLGPMVYGIDPFAPEGKKVLWEKNLMDLQGQDARTTPQPVGVQQVVVDPRDGSILVAYPGGWAQRVGDTGPIEGATLCLQTRDALVAIDPVSNRTLWTRSDVNTRNHLITDGQNVYVVELDNSNTATSTRVFRLSDGVTVKAPGFAGLYQKRLRVLGRNLLVSEKGTNEQVVLRLHDVLTGQDIWKEELPAGSIPLDSEEDTLAGAVEPSGKIHVIDLTTGKEVVKGEIVTKATEDEESHLQNVQTIHLVADNDYYYLACQKPPEANVARFGGVQPNLMAGSGLRALPVNGYVYAFHRDKGTLAWNTKVVNQMLVLSRLRELPFLLFTARQQSWKQLGGRAMVSSEASVTVVEKRTGRVRYENQNLSNNGQFHTLRLEPRAHKVELIGFNCKLTFQLDAPRERKKARESGEDHSSRAVPVPRPGLRDRAEQTRLAPEVPVPLEVALPVGR